MYIGPAVRSFDYRQTLVVADSTFSFYYQYILFNLEIETE